MRSRSAIARSRSSATADAFSIHRSRPPRPRPLKIVLRWRGPCRFDGSELLRAFGGLFELRRQGIVGMCERDRRRVELALEALDLGRRQRGHLGGIGTRFEWWIELAPEHVE